MKDRPGQNGHPRARMTFERWLYRVGRSAGWLLVPVTLVDLLSGYALVHSRLFAGLVGKVSAFRLHVIFQPAFVVLFVVHLVPYAYRALRSRRVPGRAAATLLAVLCAALAGSALYLAAIG